MFFCFFVCNWKKFVYFASSFLFCFFFFLLFIFCSCTYLYICISIFLQMYFVDDFFLFFLFFLAYFLCFWPLSLLLLILKARIFFFPFFSFFVLFLPKKKAFCSAITGLLATQSLLRGMGVGDSTATAASVRGLCKKSKKELPFRSPLLSFLSSVIFFYFYRFIS